jgi:hypothetical protein
MDVHVLRIQIGRGVRSTHLVQLDYVGVVQTLHDVHLTVHLLQVAGVQLGLVYDLDGHLEQDPLYLQLDGRSPPHRTIARPP